MADKDVLNINMTDWGWDGGPANLYKSQIKS